MRLPYAVQGAIYAPILVVIVFVLKGFCSGEGFCIADPLAIPIFLPLIAIYRIFGENTGVFGQEFLFVILYWGVLGFLAGFILDQYTRRSQYSLEQHPPL